jgi:hypothetical protein
VTTDLFPAGIPRINHVAMSLPAEQLGDAGRAELIDFYGDCFGWQELPTETEDRKKMIFSVGHWDNFVFLHAEDSPMRAPRLDHFGMSVRSRADLEACWERVARRRDADARVDVIEPQIDDFDVVKIHAFYVRFLLPMMVEVQYWEMG